MTLLHPSASSEIYKVGSIIDGNAAPSDDWLICEGQVLAQADYPEYVAVVEDLHPYRFETFNVYNELSDGDELYGSGNNGSYVLAVGSGVYIKTSDGENFTVGSMPSVGTSYRGLAWNGSVWCTAGYNTTEGATSSDGESWTSRTLPAAYTWKNVVWDGTYFILASTNNTQVYRSTDGINWNTTGTFPATGIDQIKTIGSGVTLAWDQNFYYLTEDSGATWTTYYAPTLYESYNIASTNGIFIKGFQSSPQYQSFVEYSTDGKEWHQRRFQLLGQYEYPHWNAIDWLYADGWYFGVPYGFGWGMKSPDLKTFYPWYVYMATEVSDTMLQSINDKMIVFSEYHVDGCVYVADKTPYNSTTHFQIPRYDAAQRANTGQRQFIKVK
jgi:hypothetical protein